MCHYERDKRQRERETDGQRNKQTEKRTDTDRQKCIRSRKSGVLYLYDFFPPLSLSLSRSFPPAVCVNIYRGGFSVT